MTARISENDGLTLKIDVSPRTGPDVIVVRLVGTNFDAQLEVGNESAEHPDVLLAAFLERTSEARSGESFAWLSSCQDLRISVDAPSESGGLFILGVYMASNSDDDCNWSAKSSLLVDANQLRQFARAVPRPT